MATYTESFPNDGVLGTATEDLTWNVGGFVTPANVVSGQMVLQGSDGGGRAEHNTSSSDMFVQIDWTGGTTSNQTMWLMARAGDNTDIVADGAVSFFVIINGSDLEIHLAPWGVSGSNAANGSLLGTSPIATWRLEVEGTTARGYRNGVLVISGDVSGFSPDPAGTKAGLYSESALGTPKPSFDAFSFGDLGSSGGGSIDRTTDVPFLQANDRYQVVACVKAGTSTTTSEFRYWNASAPAWDLALESDAQYPPFHTLDENSTYPTASIETPFKDLKTGQEDQIQGVYVEYYARPTALTESTVTSTYSVGFTCRVEGVSTPGYERAVGTSSVLVSGIVVSTNQVVELTAEVNASDTWPNVRTVFLPCRMPGKIRAARVILSEIHLVAIRRVQLMGKLTPGRDA